MAYLLDTDVVIQALAGNAQTTTALDRLAPERLAISLISVGEIYEGAFRSANPKAHLTTFRRFLRSFRVLGLNDPLMEQFAQIRSLLRRHGQLIPDFDILLGATAIYYDLTLLTYNIRHLKRVEALKVHQPNWL